ncbi:MAG: hypothetical protein RLZZ293_1259 [Pseudomonadota bacterium]|jgi:phosphoribosylglycinamide formyltransferase 2
MQLGTALTNSALRVMLLGGGELGKEVVIALQRFGVETIVVDRYANAPAMQVAHYSYVIDMSNPQQLRELIQQQQPDLIVPEIEAIATEILLEVEANQQALVIPTARAVNLTMNRAGIRRLAAEELNLPTSSYRFASNENELISACQEVGFPCFIKPVMSSSGKGQSLVTQASEINQAWQYANQGARVANNQVIVESLIDFDFEITLLTVRAKDHNGQIKTHFCAPIGHRQVNGDYVESWQEQAMSALALARAQEIALQITNNLGGLGVFGVELFVKNDMVWFSEVSPRPHDTGMVTMISQYQSEFELHARAILGLPVDTRLREHGASHVLYAGIDGTDLSYVNLDQALAVANSDLRLFAKPQGFTKRRMGVALSYASDTIKARQQAQQIIQQIQVVKG